MIKYMWYSPNELFRFVMDTLNHLRLPYTATIVSVSPAASAFMYARTISLVR